MQKTQRTTTPAAPLKGGPVQVSPDSGGAPGVAGAIHATGTDNRDAAGVFLSPRVVDQQAFEDYAARLRALLDESSAASTDAREALAEFRELSKGSSDALARQRTLLDAGSKLVKAVDAKTAQLESAEARTRSLIEKLESAAEKATAAGAEVDARLDAALEGRLATFEATIDERVRTLTSHFESTLDARLDGVTDRLAEANHTREALESLVRDATDNTLAVLNQAHERAARLAGWDPADIVDGAGVGQPSRDSLADLMQRAEAMQHQAKGAIDQMATLKGDASGLIDTLRTSLDSTRDGLCQLDEERETLEHRLENAKSETRRLAEAAAPLAEVHERAEKTASQLASLLVQTRAMRERESASELRLTEAVERAHEALSELEPWRDVCFTTGADAQRITLPPVLQTIAQRFQDGLARDIHEMASALQSVARRSSDDETTASR